jgi:hypothetical protein
MNRLVFIIILFCLPRLSEAQPELSLSLKAGPTGAGAARAPRHHVLPQEKRKFFEERGFKGDLDIDNFTVELETAEHQAQHGGGNWVEGRKWDGEWNKLIMNELKDQEEILGRHMTVAEIMKEVEALMKTRRIPIRFVPYRGE